MGLESYTEIYKLKENRSNLDVGEDGEINSKLHMASDGYGKVKVKGKKGGEYLTVTTGDNPVEAEVESSVESSQIPQEILKQILPTFKSILKESRAKTRESMIPFNKLSRAKSILLAPDI